MDTLSCIDPEARSPGDQPRRPLPLHEAIAAAYKGRVTQLQLAVALGVDPATVSRWSRDVNSWPTVTQLRDLERLSGRPPGWVDIQAGLITPAVSVPDAVAVDPRLSDPARAVVLRAYEAAVSHSKHAGISDTADNISGRDTGNDLH